MEMTPHPGITMHKIPVEGGAGLLYVLGTIVMFLLALPQLAPLAALGLVGGVLLAPALYRWRARSLTGLSGGTKGPVICDCRATSGFGRVRERRDRAPGKVVGVLGSRTPYD